jgi:hypothetical protein
MTVSVYMIRVADLMDAGLVSRAEELHGYNGRDRFEARLESDGTIICGTKIYTSLSVAAGEAITARSGKAAPGRNYFSVNGWKFWHVVGRNGETKTLAELRLELFEARSRGSGNN